MTRLNENLYPPFAQSWLTSNYGRAQLVLADKSTTIGALYKDDVKDILVPIPPREEQEAISSHLGAEIAKVDGLIGKIREAIDRLKEYRTALISVAVTGKIDVRQEVA